MCIRESAVVAVLLVKQVCRQKPGFWMFFACCTAVNAAPPNSTCGGNNVSVFSRRAFVSIGDAVMPCDLHPPTKDMQQDYYAWGANIIVAPSARVAVLVAVHPSVGATRLSPERSRVAHPILLLFSSGTVTASDAALLQVSYVGGGQKKCREVCMCPRIDRRYSVEGRYSMRRIPPW